MRRGRASAWLWLAAVLAAGATLAGTTARAQDPSPSAGERDAARAAYRAGVAAVHAEDWATAHDQFARSYELFPHPRTQLNLAGAQAQTGRLVDAMESYRTYLREAEAAGEDAPSIHAAQAELAELEPRIPRATLSLPGLLGDDELRLDDTTLSHAVVGAPLSVNPGDHRVSVLRLTTEVVGRDFTAVESEHIEVSLEVPAPPPPAEPEPEATPESEQGDMQLVVGAGPQPIYRDDSPFSKWWFWAITGVVVIAAIVTTGVVVNNALTDDPYPGNAGVFTVTEQ